MQDKCHVLHIVSPACHNIGCQHIIKNSHINHAPFTSHAYGSFM